MKILTVTVLAAFALLGGGQALAAGSSHHSATRTLTVAMHDPGCHWFSIDGKYSRTASVAGPIRVRNLDENTLKVASHTGLRFIHVGNSIVLSRGNYVVMMVGQAVDDNYLKLSVR